MRLHDIVVCSERRQHDVRRFFLFFVPKSQPLPSPQDRIFYPWWQQGNERKKEKVFPYKFSFECGLFEVRDEASLPLCSKSVYWIDVRQAPRQSRGCFFLIYFSFLGFDFHGRK
jgi:hypothetical protein